MKKFITQTIQDAGKAVKKKYGKVGIKYTKGHVTNIVTEADLASEKIIIDKIKKKFPHHGIVSEESGRYHDDVEYVWYIDPLDGSNNFVSQLPLFCIMFCVAKNNEPFAGAILDPINDRLLYAEKGKGIELNGKPVHCSEKERFADSTGYVSSRIFEDRIPLWHKLLEQSKQGMFWVHTFGSVGIAAAYISSGWMDWLIGTNILVWDYACPVLLLQESGCLVTNSKGEEWELGDSDVIAANPALHPELLSIVQKTK